MRLGEVGCERSSGGRRCPGRWTDIIELPKKHIARLWVGLRPNIPSSCVDVLVDIRILIDSNGKVGIWATKVGKAE